MHVLKTVLIVLEVLLLFNLLIFVHELGHFLAARWRGLKVERFAIWFGKPIWKKNINGVEYCLGSIPAGGYVSLPQMAPMDLIEGKAEDGERKEPLPAISPLDKIIVAFAGPLFSFLLAVAFAVVVWAVGKPQQSEPTTTIGWADIDGPAWKAGLRPGDKILEVDNKPVSQFAPPAQDSIIWRTIASEGTNIPIKFLRDGQEQMAYPVPVRVPTKWYERKSLRQIMIQPEEAAIVFNVFTNSPIAEADVKSGDRVVAVDGKKIYSWLAILHAATNPPTRAVTLTIERGTNVLEKIITPEKPLKPADGKPSFGIAGWLVSTNGTNVTVMAHPGVGEQIRSSVSQIVGTLSVLVSRKSQVGVQQLGGPVMIVRVYKSLFENEDGWRLVLWFSVIMNVNLALLNLLPLPVLDGGHITLALIEMVRRRPVSGKILNYVQSAFAIALIGFMVFIAFFDAGDWIRAGRKESRQEQIPVFAPKK
jgi:regulator of sigma E protease